MAAGLLSFAFQWRTIVKAFRGLAGKGGQRNMAEGEVDPSIAVEVPNR